MAGSFDGWTRVAWLSKFPEGVARFAIFLSILESIGFTIATGLGVICVIQVGSVFL